jgi:hypothetical protein
MATKKNLPEPVRKVLQSAGESLQKLTSKQKLALGGLGAVAARDAISSAGKKVIGKVKEMTSKPRKDVKREVNREGLFGRKVKKTVVIEGGRKMKRKEVTQGKIGDKLLGGKMTTKTYKEKETGLKGIGKPKMKTTTREYTSPTTSVVKKVEKRKGLGILSAPNKRRSVNVETRKSSPLKGKLKPTNVSTEPIQYPREK